MPFTRRLPLITAALLLVLPPIAAQPDPKPQNPADDLLPNGAIVLRVQDTSVPLGDLRKIESDEK